MKKILFLILGMAALAVSQAWACGGDCPCQMKSHHGADSGHESMPDSQLSGNGGNFTKGASN